MTDHRARPLPEQVIVKPRRGPLNPQDDSDDREQCTGHIISSNGYIFRESGASNLLFEYENRLRSWLAANSYQHTSDLQHDYLALSGLHGIWTRSDTWEDVKRKAQEFNAQLVAQD